MARIQRVKSLYLVPTGPSDNSNCPTLEAISKAKQLAQEKPNAATADDDGLLRLDGKFWVPDTDNKLKPKLFTVAHAGLAGHRGFEATEATLREEFFRKGLAKDAQDFVSNCLLCMFSQSGTKA